MNFCVWQIIHIKCILGPCITPTDAIATSITCWLVKSITGVLCFFCFKVYISKNEKSATINFLTKREFLLKIFEDIFIQGKFFKYFSCIFNISEGFCTLFHGIYLFQVWIGIWILSKLHHFLKMLPVDILYGAHVFFNLMGPIGGFKHSFICIQSNIAID